MFKLQRQHVESYYSNIIYFRKPVLLQLPLKNVRDILYLLLEQLKALKLPDKGVQLCFDRCRKRQWSLN